MGFALKVLAQLIRQLPAVTITPGEGLQPANVIVVNQVWLRLHGERVAHS